MAPPQETDRPDARLRETVLEKTRELLSVDGKSRKMEVDDVYIKSVSDPADITKITKQARLGRSYADRIYADVKVTDKETGREIKKGTIHVGNLPVETPMKTYLVNGTHYQGAKQEQLKGTAYTYRKASGEVHSDWRMERGKNFKMRFNPESEKFSMQAAGGNYALLPMLRMLGVSEDQLKKAWGTQLYNSNKDTELKERDIRKFAKRNLWMTDADEAPLDEVKDRIKKHFLEEAEINPEASELTLGKPYKRPTPDALLDGTQKILKIHRGEAEEDRRDEAYFKRYRDMPDTIADHLSNTKFTFPLKNKIQRRLDSERIVREDIGDLISKPLDKHLTSYFTRTRLQGAGTTTNLLDIVSNDSKITIMGEGGISSAHRVSKASRDVSPSAMNFIDPVNTPQGSAGISQHLAQGTSIANGDITATFLKRTTGEEVQLKPIDLAKSTVAFPEEFDITGKRPSPKRSTARAVRNGEILEVPIKEVDYIAPSRKHLYSEATNLIPYLSSNSAGRAILGTQQMAQALPLSEPDAPLVRSASNEEDDPKWLMGMASPVSGKVTSVSQGKVRIRGTDDQLHTVNLYENMPLNHSSFMHSKPLVQAGDEVTEGQPLADNPFTKNGTLALGRNLNVALTPWKGYNYEDGIVMSESAAKKMASEHLHNLSTNLQSNERLTYQDFGKYARNYPERSGHSAQIDRSTGLVKEGAVVEKGDILAHILQEKHITPEDKRLSSLGKGLIKPWVAKPIVWENDAPGTVIESKRAGNRVSLYVRSTEPFRLADKLSDRSGHKGVATKIIPDNEMPIVKRTGKPVDVLIDPSSIPSRVNVGQLMEMAAGKVAEETGQPFIQADEDPGKNLENVKKLVKDSGVPLKETIIDQTNGREIPNIMVAPKFLMKLEHQVEHKMQDRGPSNGYSIDKQPIKGRAVDNLTFYAMVGHGAKKNLAEMANLKGTENAEWWAQYESGAQNLTLPKEPTYTWNKFEAMMKGAGINVRRDNDKLLTQPLTDEETLSMSNGEVTNAEVFRKKDMKPASRGIFDPFLFGDDQKQWSHISLPEPVLNPVFKKAVSRITDMSLTDIDKISEGAKTVDGKTGGEAMEHILSNIDVDKELSQLKKDVKNVRPTERNKFYEKSAYLEGLKKFNMQPTDAYMMRHVPVLPAIFRNPAKLPDGNEAFPSVNYNYHDLLNVKDGWEKAVTDKGRQKLRRDMYRSVGAVTGMGEPLTNSEARGLVKEIVGKGTKAMNRQMQAKEGYFQRKVMRKRQEVSGGSVITVEPELDVDEVLIPKEMAWTTFEPMVARRMTQQGMTLPQARERIRNRDKVAEDALRREVESRPVWINRHPSWQKHNIMAAKPKLHDGFDIKVPNLPINNYFGGDFDGDTMSMHVPVTTEAVEEAYNYLPSKLFTKSGTGQVMLQPQGSALAGLYDLTGGNTGSAKTAAVVAEAGVASNSLGRFISTTLGPDGTWTRRWSGQQKVAASQPAVYKDKEDLKADLLAGVIQPQDLVKYVKDGKTLEQPAGRAVVNMILPVGFDMTDKQQKRGTGYQIAGPLTKQNTQEMLQEIAKQDNAKVAPVANELSRLGFDRATYMGLSLSIDDMDVDNSGVQRVVDKMKDDLQQARTKKYDSPEAKDSAITDVFGRYEDALNKATEASLPVGNGFRTLFESGANGNRTQLRQIVGAPSSFQRATGEQIPIAVETPFSKGLTPGEYYVQQTGGRFGLVQRQLGTSEPGEIGKDLFSMNTTNNVTTEDCGTTRGISRPVSSRDVIGRYLSTSQKAGKRNDLVTSELVQNLSKRRIRTVTVRSPLMCEAEVGVCKYCYGIKLDGNEPRIGDPVGVEDSQGVVDRLASVALKSWHLSGGREATEMPFDKYKRLVNMTKNVPDKAILARQSGTISNIEENALGGWDVYVNQQRHRIPKKLGLQPGLSQGTRVKEGDQLSATGNIKVQELLQHKGIDAVQGYMVDEMSDIFDANKPGGIHRRSLENLVASMTNLAEVKETGDSEFLPYQIAPANKLEAYNKSLREQRDVQNAVGYPAGDTYSGIVQKGETVTQEMVPKFRQNRIRQIWIQKQPVRYDHILKRAEYVPQYKNNWLAQLNQKYLQDTVAFVAGAGAEADLYGPDPIPGYAYGTDTTDPRLLSNV